jgi:hypothetical protein
MFVVTRYSQIGKKSHLHSKGDKHNYRNTNYTNGFISNQGPIKGKIITMIKYMDTMCNVYTQYNLTIKITKITKYNNNIRILIGEQILESSFPFSK